MKADLCFHAAGRWNLEEASSQLHNPLWWEKARWLRPPRLSGLQPGAADSGTVGAPG